MHFADHINQLIDQKKSCIIAGFDPRPESIPTYFHKIADKYSSNNDQYIYKLLTEFHGFCLSIIADKIVGIKPNIAFFEAFGIAGIKAFSDLCNTAKAWGLPVIADAKRGDIGTTATAYAQAFLGTSKIGDREFRGFDVSALTVNPFLGHDTLETFVQHCLEYEKGIFILVKTSNPQSGWIQNCTNDHEEKVSEMIAQWISEQYSNTIGSSGYSSIGAVVGATYPEEAKALRTVMPKSIFLIPGVGSQGGSMEEAKAGFGSDGKGGLVNISRGLLSAFPDLNADLNSLRETLTNNLSKF